MKKAKAFVSVCVPVHNFEKYVGETIESLLDQDYDNYEVVILDNASTDSTPKIAKSFKDPRVRYLRFEELVPAHENWNRVFKVAKGEYVSICHADDTYNRNYVSKCAAYLDSHPSSSAVFSSAYLISQKGERLGKSMRPASLGKVIGHRELALFCAKQGYFPLICPTFMVRASAAKKCGKFDLSRKFAMDMDYYFRLLDHGKIGFLNEPLVNYRQHPAQGSVNLSNTIDTQAEFFSILEREFEKGGISLGGAERRKFESFRRWGRMIDGISYAKFGKTREALKNSSESFSPSDSLIDFPSPKFIFRGAFSAAFLLSLYLGLGKPFSDAVYWYKRKKRE